MKNILKTPMPVFASLAVAVATLVLASDNALHAQRADAFSASWDHPAIQYDTGSLDNAVTRLNQRLADGAVELSFDAENGYLRALLRALDLSESSQLLVFSETSNQASLIDPHNPRALYFDEATSVGWVRGADQLEVATHDPRQGMVFYTLDQTPVSQPQLERKIGCLQCHLTWDTLAVPGMLTISTFPMSDNPNAYASGVVVDHRTPLNQRWGGWYVTGIDVPEVHYGNLPVIWPEAELDNRPPTPRIESVDGLFDTTGYLAGTSDVAALMVLGHQSHAVNLITRLGWEARVEAQSSEPSGEIGLVEQAAIDLVDYLLFVDEAPIRVPITGSSGFTEQFSSSGPRDRHGRSLTELDLKQRLFRYPLSYMVYAEAFDALPARAKDLVYDRLWQVLSGAVADDAYDGLTLADRRAVVDILIDTKDDVPSYFHALAP